MNMLVELGFILTAYLLGSIPTAVWVGKSFYGLDVREHGSKNAGATNTFRVLGKKPGTIVLLVDVVKGVLAVLIPSFFYQTADADARTNLELICAISAVLGHVFPVFAGFRGGKGVATSLGVIIGVHPPAAAICLGIFLIVFVVFHYVSLGAICAAIAFPLLVNLVFGNEQIWLMVFSVVLSLAVVVTHHKNIKRLLAGNENKMNLFRKSS
jgi:acyl phosphate:glycerol-3-phosphate acyltransferase